MAPSESESDIAVPRAVAVCLLLAFENGSITSRAGTTEEPSILLVSSRRHAKRFVMPKGGIESGETASEAALREAWEEGGLLPDAAIHISHLVTCDDNGAHVNSPTKNATDPDFIPASRYSIELFVLTSTKALALAEKFPESSERTRKWVHGWNSIEAEACWGKRAAVMHKGLQEAKRRMGLMN